LVGDQKYCHKQYRNRSGFTKFVQSDRVFLHAERLGFWDLQNQWREYDIELPLELKEFVKILR
jgi:23S rRNA-/tRNA-specific pseudouridylate synthase